MTDHHFFLTFSSRQKNDGLRAGTTDMEVDETESLQSYSSSSTVSRISTNSNESGNYRRSTRANRPNSPCIANPPLSSPPLADQPLKLTKRWQLHHEREEEQQFNSPKNGKSRSLFKIDGQQPHGTFCKSSHHSKLIHSEFDRLMPATSSSHHNPHLQLTNYHFEPHGHSSSRLVSATEDVAHENHPPNQCVNLNGAVSEPNGSLVHGLRPMSCQNVENCNCHQYESPSPMQANADHQRCLKKRRKKKRFAANELGDDNCFAGGLLGGSNLKKLGNEQMNLTEQKSTVAALNSNHHLPAAKSNSKTNSSRTLDERVAKVSLNASSKLAGPNGGSSAGHEGGSKCSSASPNEDAFKSQLHQHLNKLSSYDNDHHYHLQFDGKQQSSPGKQQKIAHSMRKNSIKSKPTNSDQQTNGSLADRPQTSTSSNLITNPTMACCSSAFGTASGFQSMSPEMSPEIAEDLMHKLNRIPSEPRRGIMSNWFKVSSMSANTASSLVNTNYEDANSLNDDLNLAKIQLTANQPRTPRKHQDSCQTNSSNLTALTDQIMNSDEDDLDDLIDGDDEEEIDELEESKHQAPRKGLLGGNRAASNDLGKFRFIRFTVTRIFESLIVDG